MAFDAPLAVGGPPLEGALASWPPGGSLALGRLGCMVMYRSRFGARGGVGAEGPTRLRVVHFEARSTPATLDLGGLGRQNERQSAAPARRITRGTVAAPALLEARVSPWRVGAAIHAHDPRPCLSRAPPRFSRSSVIDGRHAVASTGCASLPSVGLHGAPSLDRSRSEVECAPEASEPTLHAPTTTMRRPPAHCRCWSTWPRTSTRGGECRGALRRSRRCIHSSR